MSLSKPRHGKTSFQNRWLLDPDFKNWLKEVPENPYIAKCSLCPTALISISSMGRQALASHMTGRKHKDKEKASDSLGRPISSFFTPPTSVATVSAISTTASISEEYPRPSGNEATCPRGLQKFILNEKVTKAEIMWTLQCVMSHKSMRMAARDVSLFQLMFPDSDIASRMQLQRTKIGYILLFGLAPFFKQELQNIIAVCPEFVVGFDESLNKVCQRQQMDLNIRFWDNTKGEVCTRYYTSAFLGSCKASDLLKSFMECLPPLRLSNILQVSMDGPNVNHKFLSDLRTVLKEESPENPEMLDLGSCGLHTLHNAFKNAMLATGWDLVSFLRAIYNFFKDVPARRALYTSHTNSTIFPMKFCPIRWLDNVPVAQRAIEMLPHLQIFLNALQKEKKKPTSDSFLILEKNVKDPMIGPKLAFFKSFASDVEPFLREFQSDWPLAPFLHSALSSVVQTTMERFVKPDVISSSVDVQNTENLLHSKQVEIGFATKQEMRKCKELSQLQILTFKHECRNALQKFVLKVMEKSPLKYKVTKALSSLDPTVAGNKEIGNIRFTNLLDILVNKNRLDGTSADKAAREYKMVCKDKAQQFVTFKRKDHRLDRFWMQLLGSDDIYTTMRRVLQLVFILSHGNANLERGFSVNSDCLVENMLEETLVAHRTVYDTVNAVGGVEKLDISKSIVHAARNANMNYKHALEAKKSCDEAKQQNTAKRKMNALVLQELSDKKLKIMEDARKEAEIIETKIKALTDS